MSSSLRAKMEIKGVLGQDVSTCLGKRGAHSGKVGDGLLLHLGKTQVL